jgi:hypothetical protein
MVRKALMPTGIQHMELKGLSSLKCVLRLGGLIVGVLLANPRYDGLNLVGVP